MIYCRKCGKEIPHDSKFCPYCGATTSSETSEGLTPSDPNFIKNNQIKIITYISAGFALLGALLVAISIFQPWIRVGYDTAISLADVSNMKGLSFLAFGSCALIIYGTIPPERGRIITVTMLYLLIVWVSFMGVTKDIGDYQVVREGILGYMLFYCGLFFIGFSLLLGIASYSIKNVET